MKIPCPICGDVTTFDRHAPKEVIAKFKVEGCTSLQFDHNMRKIKQDEPTIANKPKSIT